MTMTMKAEEAPPKTEVLHVALVAPAQVVVGETSVQVVSFDCEITDDGPVGASTVLPAMVAFCATRLYGRKKPARMKVTIHVPVSNIASIVRQVRR